MNKGLEHSITINVTDQKDNRDDKKFEVASGGLRAY